MLADSIINQKQIKQQSVTDWVFNWEDKGLVVLHAYRRLTQQVRSRLNNFTSKQKNKKTKQKTKLEIQLAPYWRRNNTYRYILKKKEKKKKRKQNKNSNRTIKDYDNNKDNIFIHTAEKCAFYKSLEQKQKPKKATFGNIEYNGIEICTIVSVFCI